MNDSAKGWYPDQAGLCRYGVCHGGKNLLRWDIVNKKGDNWKLKKGLTGKM